MPSDFKTLEYIVGTPKSMLKAFEAELLKEDWTVIRDGVEVKLCTRPLEESNTPAQANGATDTESTDDPKDVAAGQCDNVSSGGDSMEFRKETFILCRSRDRSKKEEEITRRFEKRLRSDSWP